MKRILFLNLIALAGFTFSATAQDSTTAKKTPEEKLQSQMTHLKKQLNLTAQQEISVDSINRVFVQQATALRNNNGNRRDKLQSLKKIQDNHNTAMKTVLDEKQYAAYQQMQEEQIEKRKQRRAGMKNGQ